VAKSKAVHKSDISNVSLADCGRRVLDVSKKTLFLCQQVRTLLELSNDVTVPDANLREALSVLRVPLAECYSALLGDNY